MASVEKQRERLVELLKELFQLDQPDLDFGFYRIMHAKADQVMKFLEGDLLNIIRDAFDEVDEGRVAEAKAAYEAAIQQAKQFGSPDPKATEPVIKAKAAYEAEKDGGSNEGDVYDHLYRFFERYYDNGDFLSRRYFARETDGKAAPYAVPYDGREVYLHWANRDQYYIKSTEYLSNYAFKPTESPEFRSQHGQLLDNKSETTRCRIVRASEGEHDNVKSTEKTERYFIIHANEPLRVEQSVTGQSELIIQFEYRVDPEKTGQESTWRKKRLDEASAVIKDALATLPEAENFQKALLTPAPTESDKGRTLLEKYLFQYTARNTMDYFIHKDLGGFLRRELDFYIKNEVMRLDDIELAEVPRVESYLSKAKVLRTIARSLIDFLAQLEDFQKKIWLKKKFVVETNYCISLDRVPEEFYSEIAANERQRREWVEIFSIDEFEGYSTPLTTEFLKANEKLLLDTALFDGLFKERVLAEQEDFDASLGGNLVHSDNFQALNLMREKLQEAVKCIYIDPPYNTDSSAIPYKNNYKHSSWGTMMQDRLASLKPLLPSDGAIFVSIDKTERTILEHTMDSVFGAQNRIEELIWSMNTNNSQVPNYSTNHEYVLVYAKDKSAASRDKSMFREPKPGFLEVMELVASLIPDYPPVSEIEEAIGKLYSDHKMAYRDEIEGQGLNWEGHKKDDPWKGLFNYKNVEYRDLEGRRIDEAEARSKNARIWVFRESDLALPATKQAASTRDPESLNYRFYTANHPITGKPVTMPKSGWKFPFDRSEDDTGRTTLKLLDEDYRIAWGDTEKKVPQIKRMLHEVETNVGKSIFVDYSDGEKQTSALFGRSGVFLAPKHADFVSRFISHTTKASSQILDCFGGSASTGHAVLSLNRADNGTRKYHLVEMGSYFDSVTLPRMLKAVFASKWNNGKPTSRDGMSHILRYMRLESYEDALNNLSFNDQSGNYNKGNLPHDYILKYFIDFETKGSPSLLNISLFSDPRKYTLEVKNPGTDEYVEKQVDLIETFNWLLGLYVEHLDFWRGYEATFKREKDPELPDDSGTRLILGGSLKETLNGSWQLRKIEGYTLKTPGDYTDKEKTLVIWRKLTGDLEQDNLVLDEWFKKYRLSTQDTEFDVIYVNGSNNLPNLRQDEETWKVRLIEEAFHQTMWDEEG